MIKQPGSYTPNPERMRGRAPSLGTERRHNLNPQARIVRLFNLGDHSDGNVDAWNDFLNLFARENDGNGQVRMPGHMKVTYLDTTQMGRMFARKYPNHTQDELRLEMQAASRDFTAFVRSRADANITIRNSCETRPPDHHVHWLDGILDIENTLRPADNSKTRLAFHFKPNGRDVLREEHREIIQFWSSNGFDRTNLDRGEPHITIFNSFVEIGRVSLNAVPQTILEPQSVSLLAPKMQIFQNVPKGVGNR